MTPEEQQRLFEQNLGKRSVPFQGSFFSIVQDELELQGKKKIYDTLEHMGAVAIIPITPEGNLLFVRQYRHSIKEIILEFPAGKLDPGEDPAECAKRELQEEAGFYPNTLEYLDALIVAPGYSNERLHIFLAKDLIPSKLPHDDTEALEVLSLSLPEIQKKVRAKEIQDSKTLACLYLLSL